MPNEKRPVSQKQIEANRRNALKSSGPVSARGKAVSSQNSRKHNALPYEDPTLPAHLTAQYYGHFVPTNEAERKLVDIMVYSERVCRYCLSLETRVLDEEIADTELRSLAAAMESAARRLEMVPRQLHAAECAYRNAKRQLRSLRVKAA
jgi:hypothetical protein